MASRSHGDGESTGSSSICILSHYRDWDGREVDIAVEDVTGGVVGIEVKASATVQRKDFEGIERPVDAVGGPFGLGMVLSDRARVTPFGERIFAVSLSCLWLAGG